MEEDLVSSLTRQVKEEVIENYLTERKIVSLQIEDLQDRAKSLRASAVITGRRLNRLAYLAITPEMRERLIALLNIAEGSFWKECMDKEFSQRLRFIRVKSLTGKGKFKKLFLAAYYRLYDHMNKYRNSYEDLRVEVRAVNSNINRFQKNFDLLSLINFLKSLDTCALERKRFLGENFTAEELASVDQKLYMKPVLFEKLDVPEPLPFPSPEAMETALSDFAFEVYRKYESKVKHLMR